MDPILIAAATGVAKKVGEISVSNIWNKIESHASVTTSTKKPINFNKALEKYETITFFKCTKIKTLISRDAPVNLLDIYVDLKFKNQGIVIDQFSLIEKIQKLKRITICGTGGSGKSIFMKYLWLSFFENSNGKIPIFLELRNFNDITNDDFIVFLYKNIFQDVDNIDGFNYFKQLLVEGKFSFIFDGFDEILEDRKKIVERQISDLAMFYSDCFFVVSTRPLDGLLNWTSFSNYYVEPMSKEGVLDLIGKIEFPAKIKSKFIGALNRNLFQSHKSFLEVPLLATIMLLIFDELADIPREMHVFYEQAFWTLFKRHDASKEAFDRKLNCGLPMDQFKDIVSAFCYFSYKFGKPQFSEMEITNFLNLASKFFKIKFDNENFLKDLINNICFLQRDGLYFIFIHRSFQEYFSAYFVSKLPENEWASAVDAFPLYKSENTLSILYHMNKDRFDVALTAKYLNLVKDNFHDKSSLLKKIMTVEDETIKVILWSPSFKILNEKSEIFIICSLNSRILRFFETYNASCRYVDVDKPNVSSVTKIDKFPTYIVELIDHEFKNKDRSISGKIELDCFIGSIDKDFIFEENKKYSKFLKSKNSKEIFDFIFNSFSFKNLQFKASSICDLKNNIENENKKNKRIKGALFGTSIFDNMDH